MILSVSQKLLKELSLDFEVKWSIISSKINLLSVKDFFIEPTEQAIIQKHPSYNFLRTGTKSIMIKDEFD